MSSCNPAPLPYAGAMIARPPVPSAILKARELWAKTPATIRSPFAAAKKGGVCQIHLYDAIGKDPWSDTGIDPMDVVKAINDASGSEELEIHVNSPGGFVFDGIAIYNAIRGFKGKKTVCIDGLAASIASVIALAGDKVITNEGALWMIHDPMGGLMSFGTSEQIADDAKKTCQALDAVRDTILDIYTNRTGQSRSQLSAWMTEETWMSADEAKARGFTDEVVKAEDGCDCSCAECQAGDCPDCSCGGCAECASGGDCNDGDCDQGGGHKMRSGYRLAFKNWNPDQERDDNGRWAGGGESLATSEAGKKAEVARTPEEHFAGAKYHAVEAKKERNAGKEAAAKAHDAAVEAHLSASEKDNQFESAKANIASDRAHEMSAEKAPVRKGKVSNSSANRARTAEELYAQAMADAADLKRRFPAASGGTKQPGQPGTHAATPARRQERKQ